MFRLFLVSASALSMLMMIFGYKLKFSFCHDTFLLLTNAQLFTAAAGGSVLPVMMIMFGDTLEAFVQFEMFTNNSCNNTDVNQPFSPMPALERYRYRVFFFCSKASISVPVFGKIIRFFIS
jgi:hypothetical protein